MNVNDIIQKIQQEETGYEKVANIQESSLDSAIHAVPQTANANVADDLTKIAAELIGGEKEAEVNHAALCGQAFADAAITKFASYDMQVKTAAANDAMYKEAAYAPTQVPAYTPSYGSTSEPVEMAKEAGYIDAIDSMEKNAGFEDGISEIAGLATNEFLKGAAAAETIIEYKRQGVI